MQQTFFYKKGYFEIQDEGAQCLVLDTPLPPTKTGTFSVLDYCAGAGGKTLAFAQRFQNKGQFIACDTSEHRLQQSAIRFQRHNLIVETHILPTESLTPYHDKIDLVFVDAPCTGSGTWRRHPELKGLYDQDTFQALRITQQDILTQAAAYVKKGGILAYATCSLLPEENEQQAALFLKQHPEFGLHDAFDAPTKKGRWYTPFSTATDGYYLCCFIRTV